MDGSTILTIALIALVAAAVWAVVELALTLKSTRSTIGEVAGQVNDTIAEINPIVSKLDGMMDELDPAIRQVEPLLGKVDTAVDVLTVDLAHLDDVLGDVSSVTGIAGTAATSMGKATAAAAGVIDRITGHVAPQAPDPSLPEQASAPAADPAPAEARASRPASYITYPAKAADAGREGGADAAGEPDPSAAADE